MSKHNVLSNFLLAGSMVTDSVTSAKYFAHYHSAQFMAQSLAGTLADGYTGIFSHPPAKYFASLPIWAFNAHLSGIETPVDDFIGVTTPVSEDFSYITTRGNSCYKNSNDNLFTLSSNIGYSALAPAKSGVRRENLSLLKATHDAPSVFFYAAAPQHLLFEAAFAHMYSMVMLAELPKGRLVSFSTSILTSVSVTAPNERENSSGDSLKKLKEIFVMMTIPTQTHFKFLFLSIKRSDATAKPFRITATAPDEYSARLMLAREYVLLFAGRVPVLVVTA
jgi:hypothetical protein